MIGMLFTSNCMVYLPLLWGSCSLQHQAGPLEAYSVLLRMDSFYKTSCMCMILSNISNHIDYESSFSFPQIALQIFLFKTQISIDFDL